jgi:hypothetical protein
MKPWYEKYGTTSRTLTPEQFERRKKVLETADALVLGYYSQGRRITAEEAIRQAFDAVSGEDKAEVAREEIKEKVKERAAAVTLKPSAKSAPAKAPDAQNSLEERVGKKLKLAFPRP